MDNLVRGLVAYVEQVNGTPAYLTVIVNGTVVTGTMMKSRDWFEAVAPNYPQWTDLVEYLHLPDPGDFDYLHLRDAFVEDGDLRRPLGQDGYARIGIASIDGCASIRPEVIDTAVDPGLPIGP